MSACEPYVCSALRGQKKLWDPLELELQVVKLELWIVVSQHVGARKNLGPLRD